MKTLFVPVAAVAIVAAAALAHADNWAGEGAIKSLDTQKRVITMTNGRVFHFDKSFNASPLKPGAQIEFQFEKKANKNYIRNWSYIMPS